MEIPQEAPRGLLHGGAGNQAEAHIFGRHHWLPADTRQQQLSRLLANLQMRHRDRGQPVRLYRGDRQIAPACNANVTRHRQAFFLAIFIAADGHIVVLVKDYFGLFTRGQQLFGAIVAGIEPGRVAQLQLFHQRAARVLDRLCVSGQPRAGGIGRMMRGADIGKLAVAIGGQIAPHGIAAVKVVQANTHV